VSDLLGTAPEDLRVLDEPERSRYEAWVGDRMAGAAYYRLHPDRIVFTHTEVDEAFGGQGIASHIAAFALDDARARGLRVEPRCPFVAAYMRRHHAYDDLLVDGFDLRARKGP